MNPIHSGTILLAGVEVGCHVLADKRRVLDLGPIARLFGGEEPQPGLWPTVMERHPSWEALDPGDPIEYTTMSGTIFGIEALLFIDFCDALVGEGISVASLGAQACPNAMVALAVMRTIHLSACSPAPGPTVH